MKRLVLLGGGRANLFVLRALARGRIGPADVTLVAAEPRKVLGAMIPGYLAGRLRIEEVVIELRPLAARAGARLVEDRVTQIEPDARYVRLSSGARIDYDVLSVAAGAEAGGTGIRGVRDHAYALVPAGQALELPDRLAELAAAVRPPAITIAGGGAMGIAIACGIRARLDLIGRRGRGEVAVVEGMQRILPRQAERTSALAERVLLDLGIRVSTGSAIVAAAPESVRVASGATMHCDLLVWAAGGSAPSLLGESGLAADAVGRAIVETSLRSASHPDVFVAGAGAVMDGAPGGDRAGAPRAGVVLARSIRAALAGSAPPRNPPSAARLFLLDTADGAAIAARGGVAVHGRGALLLKDRLDRRLVRRLGGA